jgi:GNAT superfamily N-acetyltransferase
MIISERPLFSHTDIRQWRLGAEKLLNSSSFETQREFNMDKHWQCGNGHRITPHVYEDSIVLRNANTTVGYATFSKADASLDYIFVNPSFRRQGLGRQLVALCEKECGAKLAPASPISPIGQLFFSAI